MTFILKVFQTVLSYYYYGKFVFVKDFLLTTMVRERR